MKYFYYSAVMQEADGNKFYWGDVLKSKSGLFSLVGVKNSFGAGFKIDDMVIISFQEISEDQAHLLEDETDGACCLVDIGRGRSNG